MEEPRLKYRLGGKIEDGFTDCSLFQQVVCEDAGIVEKRKPGERTQAYRIYRGQDGFVSDPVSIVEGVEAGDLLCLAVPGSLKRPDGINHVGGIVKYKDQWQVIDANSSSGGIRIRPIEGIWQKYLPIDGWRRLKRGD